MYTIKTFDVDEQNQIQVMSQAEDIISWLSSSETIFHLKNSFDFKQSFYENIFRQINITAVNIQEQFIKVAADENGHALTEFVKKIWPDGKLGTFEKWEAASDSVYPFWFSTKFKRNDSTNQSVLYLNIHCEFHINGFPMGKLPNSILKHPEYARFFEKTDFDVQPASLGIGSFVTTAKYLEDETLNFTFYESGENLIVIETTNVNKSYQVPNELLKPHLSSLFIDNYSHWLRNDKLEFRLKNFTAKYRESLKNDKQLFQFVFDLKNRTLIDIEHERSLINIKSNTFCEIYKKLAAKLDKKEYVHMFRKLEHQDSNKISDIKSDEIYVHFPRLKINFKVRYLYFLKISYSILIIYENCLLCC